MPPVAKKPTADFEEGTPRWLLQDALDQRFDNAEEFFKRVAKAATIRQESASSTYYGFLAGRRSLPKAQRPVYLRELGVTDELLDEVDALRSVTTPRRRDRLEEVAKALADSLERLAKIDRELRRLRSRVGTLEAQRAAAATAPKSPRKRVSR